MGTRLLMGTTGGTLLSVFAQVTWGDVGRTVVLAAVGAVVSFVVTLVLQRVLKRK